MLPVIDGKACTACGKCLEVCPPRAIVLEDGSARIDDEFCEECGFCAAECKAKAIVIHFPHSTDP